MIPLDIRSRLHANPPPGDRASARIGMRGDHDLSPDLLDEMDAVPAIPAAVLIPIFLRPAGATVLFTRRSARLKSHSGQIAFPGGKVDAADDGPLVAALREAEEEIGLDRSMVEPLGYLDIYQSASGYRINPVVGLVAAEATLTLNPAEVEETFEAPLDFLMDVANHRFESRPYRGRDRTYVAIPYGHHYIWGVTAGILRNLREKVFA